MAHHYKFIIWDTPAHYSSSNDFDGYDVDSPRAGGRYQITRSAALTLQNTAGSNNVLKSKLSRYISENQHFASPVRITTGQMEALRNQRRLRPFERAERLLRFIANNASTLNLAGLRWGDGFDDRDRALAATELLNSGEIEAVLEYLTRRGFCEARIDNGLGTGIVWLTLEGAEHVEATNSNGNSDQAFVAMWFSPETQTAYEYGIAPAILDNGYQPVRIDKKSIATKLMMK